MEEINYTLNATFVFNSAWFQVNAVPAVFGLVNGQVKDKFTGLMDEDKIDAFVDKCIVASGEKK